MKKNEIENVLTQHIKEKNSVFVFPTQTAADLWADRIISVSDVTAVAMERFIAWDDFKGTSIKSQHQDKTSVPSTMRTVFASQIISENKEKPFLKSLIVPEYASNAESFSSWIASLLPSLALWKTYFEKSGGDPDEEDKDLQLLYEKYEAFLNKYNLFDPAWEVPPFKADGNHYYIFFPEILSDYTEYKPILEQSPEDITIINLEQTDQTEFGTVDFFSNSRTEIRNAALYIRKLHEEKNIPYTEIAVSIPDIDSYGPYVERDFALYEIPYVMRYAKPLSSTGAGSLFEQIQECVNSNLSFESIKTLFFNTELPWVKESLNQDLINFGQENNCICAFEYEGKLIDVWEESFKKRNPSIDLVAFYKSLKEEMSSMVKAKTFKDIRNSYFEFRKKFFDMTKCTPKTDRILSRCISELGALIDLEEKYTECKVPSPFSFFINYIGETNYLEQTSERGVQLLPYRLGAAAPFKCHIILDSSQASLAVIYKQFSFLREDKRERLLGKGQKVEDTNVTAYFIRLYKMNSTDEEVYYTASAKTFSGYAQASSYLTENDLSKAEQSLPLFEADSFALEKKWLFNEEEYSFPNELFAVQKKGYDMWQKNHFGMKEQPDVNNKAVEAVEQKIQKSKDDNLFISVTQLKNYLFCPRYWLYYNKIKLKEVDNAAQLMNDYFMGNLNHRILELYCKHLKENNLTLNVEDDRLSDQYMKFFKKSIDEAIADDENSYLTQEVLGTTKKSIEDNILDFIISFSKEFLNYRIIDMEMKMEYVIPDKHIYCKGYADCVLQNPADGSIILVDYKNTGNATPKNSIYDEGNPDADVNFQMAMYVYLMQNQKKSMRPDKCYFYSIGDKKSKEVPLDGMDKTIEKMLEVIDEFKTNVYNNEFSLEDENFYSICAGCAYKAVCRKVFTVAPLD